MHHVLSPEESGCVLRACAVVKVASCEPRLFRRFLAQRFAADRPELAAKIERLDDTELGRLRAQLAEHQRLLFGQSA